MLTRLAIKNLAIIADTAVELGPGMNVITGETGAGKSIVIGALSLVLGDRARSDIVRHGAKRAEVQALFRVKESTPIVGRLRDLDLSAEADADGWVDVVVRRTVAAGGRGRVYVNDSLVTVSALAGLMRGVVDIASQHQHTVLLDATGHLELLDRFGGLDGPLEAFREAWRALVGARRALADLAAREQARVEREDFVRFQLDEIASVDPQPGEDDGLARERERLAHAERLVGGAREIERTLTGGGSAAVSQLSDAVRSLERLATIDQETLAPLLERLQQAHIEVEDIGFEMRCYGDKVDMDPRRLEAVEDRLHALSRLLRKHGGDLAAVLARHAELAAELAGFESLEIELLETNREAAACEERARAAALTLSGARAEVAQELQRRLSEELTALAMPGAEVLFDLQPAELGAGGLDRGEMLIRTNRGEEALPLARVASGGELSRLLLALKRTLTRVDPVQVAVFDEVDTGVGGAVAEIVGRKLKEIASERQVIAITHLPQVAALGDHHLRVEKLPTDDERTETRVTPLVGAARAEELARMLGGVEITRRTREHAEELLRLVATG